MVTHGPAARRGRRAGGEEIGGGMIAMVLYGRFGSIWLDNARMVRCTDGEWYVEGETWDDTGIGSPYMPEDWRGEVDWMNFPATSIVRVG